MTWFRCDAALMDVSTKANSLAATAPFRRLVVPQFGCHAARGHELTKSLPVQKQFPAPDLEHGCKFVDGRWGQRSLRALPSGHVTLVHPEQRRKFTLGEPRPFTQFSDTISHFPISSAAPLVIVQGAYSINCFQRDGWAISAFAYK